MGITSNVYSNRPRSHIGPCGSVSTRPYRRPTFQLLVLRTPPFMLRPPPDHSASSVLPFAAPKPSYGSGDVLPDRTSGRISARMPDGTLDEALDDELDVLSDEDAESEPNPA